MGVPSSAGRGGNSQAFPNSAAVRSGGRPAVRPRTVPIGHIQGFHMEVLWRGSKIGDLLPDG